MGDMKKELKEKTVEELLKEYPNGFAISQTCKLGKIILASSHFMALAQKHPLPPNNGGYLVVEMIEET